MTRLATLCSACAIGICLGSGASAQGQTATFTPDQFRVFGAELLNAGQVGEASRVAKILLDRDPDDVAALLLAARIYLTVGETDEAVRLAKRAYWRSEDRRASFAAARIAANGHASLQQDTFAQLWLRRARQYSPDEQASDGIARDYQFLRNRNPWSTSLTFGISPSSNINNGSASRTARLFGLPFEFELDGVARALSGIEISGGFNTSYRINSSAASATFFEAGLNYRTYVMSADARAQAPTAQGSDFADGSLRFGLTHRFIIAEGQRPTTLGAQLSRAWYSGAPYSQTIDLNASHDWALSDNDNIGLRLEAQQRRSLTGTDPVTSFGITGSWRHQFDNGDAARVSLGTRDSRSNTLDSDFTSLSSTLSYDFAQPFQDMTFGFDLDYETKAFDGSRYSGGAPRDDATVRARMRVRFDSIEYFGFRPVATFEASRTSSNVDLFDREYLTVSFDLQSSF
jgi:hypothetical protein